MKRALSFLLLLVGWSTTLWADVKLPLVFSDHMVLQEALSYRSGELPAPGEEVTVAIATQKQNTKADGQGRWRVKLAPLSLGEPLTLTVQGKNTLTMKRCARGDVWVGSGQSNMAGGVNGYAKNDPVLAGTCSTNISQFAAFKDLWCQRLARGESSKQCNRFRAIIQFWRKFAKRN